MPRELEILVIKVSGKNSDSVLCIASYRPPHQGDVQLCYLQESIDTIDIDSQSVCERANDG